LKRALEVEPNSVDAMRGLTDIYSKRRGVPHTAAEEQRQKEIEQAREHLLQERRLWDWLSATGGVTLTVSSPADLT
jgi:hypothetical protein